VSGFVDVHTHVLPGVDDGTRTLEEAVATAAEAVAAGVEAMVATPHVRDDYPTSADTIADGVAALRRELRDRSIPLELHPGAELALERVAAIDPAELRRYSLAGGPYVLVEFPYRGWPAGAEAVAATLLRNGFTPMLAHPERNDAIAERPERLRPLVEAGCFVQVTSGSLTGGLGRTPRRAAEALLDRASSTSSRPTSTAPRSTAPASPRRSTRSAGMSSRGRSSPRRRGPCSRGRRCRPCRLREKPLGGNALAADKRSTGPPASVAPQSYEERTWNGLRRKDRAARSTSRPSGRGGC
jgi:protein-tyrosine phosphatase